MHHAPREAAGQADERSCGPSETAPRSTSPEGHRPGVRLAESACIRIVVGVIGPMTDTAGRVHLDGSHQQAVLQCALAEQFQRPNPRLFVSGNITQIQQRRHRTLARRITFSLVRDRGFEVFADGQPSSLARLNRWRTLRGACP
jgi:hypothetical protein